MKRSWFALVLVCAVSVGAASRDPNVLRVALSKRQLPAGPQTVVLSVYRSRLGGSPIASETRVVDIDFHGSFTTPFGALAKAAESEEERWLGVRVVPGDEGPRVQLNANASSLPVSIHIVTDAAMTANGIIESLATGFRFPDASMQATAANAGGTPQTIGTSNAAGAAATFSRSDHVHAHGNQGGGTLHSTATTSVDGFLSASDKTKLDGTVAYLRTIVVRPVVGDTAASGTALINALNGISGNSSTNPYLVKIEPGVYDIGSTALAMKTFVDIEGSGEGATFIVASRGSGSVSSGAAINAADDAELRNLTVSNTAPASAFGAGIFATGATGARVRNVTINSTGATDTSYGVFAVSTSTVTLHRVTINATGIAGASDATGIAISTSSTVTVLNSTITAKGVGGTGTNNGIHEVATSAKLVLDSSTIVTTGAATQNNGINAAGTATITNSTVQVETAGTRMAIITGGTASSVVKVFHSRILALSTSFNASELSLVHSVNSKLHVAASQIDSASSGTPKCVHVYDADMDDMNNSCPGPIG